MASSSCSRSVCSNAKCRNVMDVPKPGWKGDDREVKLCYQCFIAFSTKQFCKIFHKNLDSWSMCKSCNKKVHLKCVVSHDSYTKLQGGEVMCNDCVTPDAILIPNSEGTIVNSTSSPSPFAIVPTTLVLNDQIIDQENVSDTHSEELTPQLLAIEYDGSKAYTETQPQVQVLNGKPQSGLGRKNEQYRPRMTDQELKEISKGLNVKVKPLFEKRLTASDVGRTGRLVIPKQCAEDYFPSINNSKGKCMVFLDADKTEWKFNFRFWPNHKTRIYFLEGFDHYVRSMKLVLGDKVMFSRLARERKIVIGYRKVPSTSSSSLVGRFHKATTASTSAKRAKKGVLTTTKKNEIPTGKTTSATRKPNAPINGKSDVGVASVHIRSKRRKHDIGFTSKSNKNENKLSEVVEGTREAVQSPYGSNISSFMVNKELKIKSNKGIVTSNTHKRAPKRKTTSGTLSIFSQENPNDTESVHLNNVKVKVPIHSKRRSYEIGSISKSSKKVNKRSKVDLTSKDALELVASPEPVETQVTPIENVVALPSQPNAAKRHPRHRLDCLCIVCIQPASGSKHHVSCECRACITIRLRGKKRSRTPNQMVANRQSRNLPKPINNQPTNMPNPAEPGSSNHTHQTTVNRGSEDNRNTNNLSSLGSKILPFDLNLPPEPNEDF